MFGLIFEVVSLTGYLVLLYIGCSILAELAKTGVKYILKD